MENELSIIDSHAHLDYPQFEGKIDEVLSRAKELGVTEVISIGVKLSAVDGPRRLAETYDNVWFSAGIHPHEASSEPDACNLQAIVVAADHPKCVAIGEAGLDYFYDNAPRKVQAESFRVQIEAARQTEKPSLFMPVMQMQIWQKFLKQRCRRVHSLVYCTVSVLGLNWQDGQLISVFTLVFQAFLPLGKHKNCAKLQVNYLPSACL